MGISGENSVRKLDNIGSIWGVVIFIICLGFASFLTLIFGHVLEPFFSIMQQGNVRTFLLYLWPNGLLLFVLLVLIFTMLMHYQKQNYMEGGN